MKELPTDKKDNGLYCSYCMEKIVNADIIDGVTVCNNCRKNLSKMSFTMLVSCQTIPLQLKWRHT